MKSMLSSFQADVGAHGRAPLRAAIPWLALLFLTATLLSQSSSRPTRPLPEIPELSPAELENFKPSVRDGVQKAYARVSTDPTDGVANGRLGMILHAHALYEHAAVFYQRAGLLEPRAFRWAYYLGTVQGEAGKGAEAIAAFRKTVQLKPDYLPAQLKLADTLLAAGEREESGKIYEEVIKKASANPATLNFDPVPIALAHFRLGQIRRDRGAHRAALENYLQAIHLSPGFGAAYYALAMTYRNLGEKVKSEEQFALFQRNQAGTLVVKDVLMTAVGSLKSNGGLHFREGLRLQEEGHLEQAVAEYRQSLQGEAYLWETHSNLFSAYATLGQWEKAQEHYHTAVKLNPELWETHYNFGILQQRERRYREAADAFRKSLEINPFSAQAHSGLADMLVMEGRLTEAARHCRLALDNNPQFRFAHATLGHILYRQNQYGKAIGHFLKALTVEDERTPLLMYYLADTYAQIGNLQKAIEYAQQARQRALSLGRNELVAGAEKLLQWLKQESGTR